MRVKTYVVLRKLFHLGVQVASFKFPCHMGIVPASISFQTPLSYGVVPASISIKPLVRTALCLRAIGLAFAEMASRLQVEVVQANLSYLRFNYRHFHKRGLPGWAREDTLVHEQVEGIMKLAEAVLFGGCNSLATELEEWAATVRHGGEVPVVPETDAASQDAFASLEVYCRILSPVWCEALASGEKMFEVQRYKQKKGGNVFKFAKAGDWVLFGAAGSEQVAGVAVLSGPAARKMKAGEIEARAERLPAHLRAPFSEYMAEGVEFDLVEVQLVYDLRPLILV